MPLMNEASAAAIEAALAFLLDHYRRTHGDPQESGQSDEEPVDDEVVA